MVDLCALAPVQAPWKAPVPRRWHAAAVCSSHGCSAVFPFLDTMAIILLGAASTLTCKNYEDSFLEAIRSSNISLDAAFEDHETNSTPN